MWRSPALLDFTGKYAVTSFSPLLNPSFFLGDGLTGTGVVQSFAVPDGANFLRLGFADAFAASGTPFVGAPTSHGDDTGSLSVGYTVAAVPQPSNLVTAGILALIGCASYFRLKAA